MSEIRGAVAVITGAGSGIGRALALNMTSRGAQVALADVNAAGLEETRKALGSTTTRTYVVDVSSAAAVQEFARAVEQDFGRASILINNAGVALFGTFTELTLEEFDWLMRINFWGVIHGCKFFLPMLLRQKEARIVNISSVFGLFGPPGQTAYCSSKWAVRGFSDSLREELRAGPVKVTCVHPAGIATNVAVNARRGTATRAAEQEEALERFKKAAQISPESAAETIVQGILKDHDRVLIGRDAYFIDRLARLFPVRASAMLTSWLHKRTESKESASATTAASESKSH
ncbi:MAG TPA: SDR family oxidoreductase [Terriglobales bacterium]|nr:SDR family oxidoreductase [Terriglobales bacterium]